MLQSVRRSNRCGAPIGATHLSFTYRYPTYRYRCHPPIVLLHRGLRNTVGDHRATLNPSIAPSIAPSGATHLSTTPPTFYLNFAFSLAPGWPGTLVSISLFSPCLFPVFRFAGGSKLPSLPGPTTKCPGCKASFRIRDEHAGRTVTCPKCATKFKVLPGSRVPGRENRNRNPPSATAGGKTCARCKQLVPEKSFVEHCNRHLEKDGITGPFPGLDEESSFRGDISDQPRF